MSEGTIKAHCNKCLGNRNHSVLFTEKIHDEEDVGNGYFIYWDDTYRMIKCLGCDNICLMHTHLFSENYNDEGHPEEIVHYYPPAISKPMPKWINELDDFSSNEEQQIAKLLKEIYSALYNDSRRLAIMGIRSLLEHVMIVKIGDKGSFAKNLDSFCEAGYIASKQKDLLKAVLDVGHATTHRSFTPRVGDIITTVEICETIIEMIFIHPKKMEKVSKRIPPRK